jgi:hypothetical protein
MRRDGETMASVARDAHTRRGNSQSREKKKMKNHNAEKQIQKNKFRKQLKTKPHDRSQQTMNELRARASDTVS